MVSIHDSGTDMVLLDLGLPNMDGIDLCWRIRGVSDAPVTMVTARYQVNARIQSAGRRQLNSRRAIFTGPVRPHPGALRYYRTTKP